MKRIVLLLTCILFILPSCIFAQPVIRKMKIEELTALIDSSKTPLVVNFWASWCQPCVHEIPWFEKTIANYADQQVKLVLVSLDFGDSYRKKELERFVKAQGYRATVIWLDETNADHFCPPVSPKWTGVIPATLMVNNAQQYRAFYPDQLKEARLKLELDKLVAGNTPAQ
jgi:thiol-disulfide isomerase/thioredoxin